MKMSSIYLIIVVLFVAISLVACRSKSKKPGLSQLVWSDVKSIPANFGGISQGVSAPFSGVLNDGLLIAGGCNFPNIPAAEGGTKIFYRDILMFDGVEWKKQGELPEPMAYGVTLQTDGALYFIGGQNREQSFSSCYRFIWDTDSLVIENLPQLPFSFDNGSGALLNNRIWIVGGNQNGLASSEVWSFDLNSQNVGWRREGEVPVVGGLVQGITLASENILVVFGGFSPATSEHPAQVNQKVWIMDANEDFYFREAKNPFPSGENHFSLSGGAGIKLDDGRLLLLGGVNQGYFEEALNRIAVLSGLRVNDSGKSDAELQEEAAAYLNHPVETYQFNKTVNIFDPTSECWEVLGVFEQAALAGASMARKGSEIYLIHGELKPGIRTSAIRKLEIRKYK